LKTQLQFTITADAVLYLAKSDYVTCTVMPVDGGFRAGK
jgi:hypothetical protein